MSAGTGERGDYVVLDDLHSVDQMESDGAQERHRVVERQHGHAANGFATGHKVVIQQRLHETDLTGDLVAKGD